MVASSTYNVNIIISQKSRGDADVKKSAKVLDVLKTAAKIAAAAFVGLKVAQKAIKFVEFGAGVRRAANSLDNLASAAGESGTEIIDAIQSASDFTIDRMTAMQVANKAMLMGVAKSPEQFEELARTATVLGRAMGLDATTAIDRFTIAAGRKSVKVADDLGLMIDASIANETYAVSLGKTVDELTAAEQSQAFLNEMMKQAAPKVATLTNDSIDLAGSFEQVGTLARDMKTDVADLSASMVELTIKSAQFMAGSKSQISDLRQVWDGFVLFLDKGIPVVAMSAGVALRQLLPTWSMLTESADESAAAFRRAMKAAAYEPTGPGLGGLSQTLAEVEETANEVAESVFVTSQMLDSLSASSFDAVLGTTEFGEALDVTTGMTLINIDALQGATIATRDYNLAAIDLGVTLNDASQAEIAQVAITQLKTALDEGKITFDEYSLAVVDTQLKFGLATAESIGMTAGILELTQKLADGEITAGEYAASLAVVTGKTNDGTSAFENYKRALDAIPREITVRIREELSSAPRAEEGRMGGPTMQHGGSFTVPPGYPGDSFPMRVSSGERVSVTPASQVNDNRQTSGDTYIIIGSPAELEGDPIAEQVFGALEEAGIWP